MKGKKKRGNEAAVLEEILQIVKDYERTVCQEKFGPYYLDRIASILRENGYLGPKPTFRFPPRELEKEFEEFLAEKGDDWIERLPSGRGGERDG